MGLVGNALFGDTLTITTPAFGEGKPMPPRFAYATENISPAVIVAGLPAGARTLALIVDDPDSPSGLWTHWLVWNLPADQLSLPEGKLPPEARVGKNSFGDIAYDGPSPPAGTHRYFFRLYALDTILALPAGAERPDLLKAMEGHVIGTAETFGTYQRP